MKLFNLMAITGMAAVSAFSEPTLQNLKGTYVFTQQGNAQSNQPITGLGLMTLDGAGNVTCNETVQFPGSNMVSNCAGKYYINSDGSGTIEIMYDAIISPDASVEAAPQISTAKFKFYICNNGKQLKGIRMENGIFVVANFDKN